MAITVKELCDQYLAWCEKQWAEKTVRFYRSRLKKFVQEFGDREFASLKQIEIEDHLAEIERTVSQNTQRHNVVSITRVQNWALDRELIDKPAFKKLKKPKARHRERIPTRGEIAVILWHGNRAFRLIYQALRHSGARPNELCRAQIDDLKNDRTVIVLTKHKTARSTGKPRRIPVGTKLRKILSWAIGDRTEGPIFLTHTGKPWTVPNLSRTFSAIRDRHGLQREGEDRLVLYLSRHEFGTKATEKLGIHAASVMLGHTQITTTQRYAHADEDKLREQQDSVL